MLYKKDLEALKTENESLANENKKIKKKIRILEKKLAQETECARLATLNTNLIHIQQRQFMRRILYMRLCEDDRLLTEQELTIGRALKRLYETRPLVSVIIINKNGRDKLETLMESLHREEYYRNLEIIFVDNASSDASIEYIKTWEKEFSITVIQNQENLSFSSANNLGALSAKGDYLLFLNNDTAVTAGWLDELLITMLEHKNAGAVGAKLLYPRIPDNEINGGKSFTIQHSGIGFQDKIREGQPFIQPYNLKNGMADTDFDIEPIPCACVTAAVLLMRSTVFQEIGGFDERYVYGYEDVDLCLKLYQKGYQNYYCPACLVFHYEFGTQSKDVQEDVKRRRSENMKIFRKKWQDYLAEHRYEEGFQGYCDELQ